ncbi:hypothetical protein C8R45DRAFT_933057 [Mycena sanguinolenta]|nr:hypothetical protein C8R45DRAFT_933057 [Mycena sanguinolenta]
MYLVGIATEQPSNKLSSSLSCTIREQILQAGDCRDSRMPRLTIFPSSCNTRVAIFLLRFGTALTAGSIKWAPPPNQSRTPCQYPSQSGYPLYVQAPTGLAIEMEWGWWANMVLGRCEKGIANKTVSKRVRECVHPRLRLRNALRASTRSLCKPNGTNVKSVAPRVRPSGDLIWEMQDFMAKFTQSQLLRILFHFDLFAGVFLV